VTETELPQKQPRIGRTRRVLCEIRGFVDRHLTTKAVLVFTILLLLASWIYPPWIVGSYRNVSHGWFFVFDTTRDTAMRVDFGRLLLIDAIIAAIGGLLAWAVFSSSTARHAIVRLAFYAVFVLPFIAVVCLAAVVIGNVQREVAKRASLPKAFDWSTGALIEDPKTSSPYDALITYLVRQRPVTVDIPGHGWVEFPAGMSRNEIATVIKQKFDNPSDVVAADDLKKIILFDVELICQYGKGHTYCTGFHGRVRTDLRRDVEKLGLKASFYDATDSLIQVRTFDFDFTNGPLQPGKPSSFSVAEILPWNSKYRFEVSEARYVQYLSTDPNAGK
jgi:hypothetical protein